MLSTRTRLLRSLQLPVSRTPKPRALTAAVKQAVDFDLSNIATKTDNAEVRREMADMKAELVKWVVGVGFAQVPTIVAALKLFPGARP